MNFTQVLALLCLFFSASQMAQARDRQSLPVLGDVRDVDFSVNPWKMERTNPTGNTSEAPVRIELVKVQPFNKDSIKLHRANKARSLILRSGFVKFTRVIYPLGQAR